MREHRFAAFELRAAGAGPGTLAGVLMRYGSTASIGGLAERFEPGSLTPADRVIANMQHSREAPLAVTGPGGGLALDFGAEEVRAEVELPDTAAGRDVAVLARRGVLSGFSIEFRAVRDGVEGGVRVVREAVLLGLGIVDVPAYSDATIRELRARIEAAAPRAPRKPPWWR